MIVPFLSPVLFVPCPLIGAGILAQPCVLLGLTQHCQVWVSSWERSVFGLKYFVFNLNEKKIQLRVRFSPY